MIEEPRVKGAAPLRNLSVWEPRFGGFVWGWRPGWYRAADVKNHVPASLC